MGRLYYEKTLPNLIKALNRSSAAMEGSKISVTSEEKKNTRFLVEFNASPDDTLTIYEEIYKLCLSENAIDVRVTEVKEANP